MASLVKMKSEYRKHCLTRESKGLVTTGADHMISKPETELSPTFGLGSRRLRRGLERVTKGSR